MKNLLIVMPWYGRVPNYFKFYLDSIRNVTFDTLLVSDSDFSKIVVPDNVRLVKMTMEEFRVLASQKLCVEVALDKPYKVCDFRPMFGKIFEDYLGGYKYWGYGDADLIYGQKLDQYVERIVSEDYDVASMHCQYLAAPFAMLKNNEKCKALYKASNVWYEVATTPVHYQFEECGKNVDWPKLEFGKVTIEEYGKTFDSFSNVLHREEQKGMIRYFHEDLITEHISKYDVVYKKGKRVFLNENEIYIFHNLFVKGRRYFRVPGDEWKNFENYMICPTGYYKPNQFCWRGIIGRFRIFCAVLGSLRVNGFSRIVSWFKYGY